MANSSLRMTLLKQVLIQKSKDTSNSEISRILGISRPTVIKYVNKAKMSLLSWQSLLSLSDAELANIFMEPDSMKDQERLLDLNERFSYMDKELKRTGVSRYRLWLEYKQEYPHGYNYSRFCYHYQMWRKQLDVPMHFEHKAGDKMQVDFAGKKLEYMDRKSGKIIQVEVFVALLVSSQYTYVEASQSQKKEDFIGCLENALYYFGGVPRAIITDNLKSGVNRASRYEAQLNESLEEFGNHYSTSIMATRPAKPRDKPLVEGAVRIVYNRIYAALRNQTFYSLWEINQAIRQELKSYNSICFQSRDDSRRALYDKTEKSILYPLPTERYEIKHFAMCTVQKSSHIRLGCDKHYYSVPFRYIGKKAKVVYTRRSVEVYCGNDRIAFHLRIRKAFGYTTEASHMPSSHRFVSDWNPEKFKRWAQGIGAPTSTMIQAVLNSKAHPEQAYKSCVGILSFARKVGKERLNNACQRALSYYSISYRTIKEILEKGLDNQTPQTELFTAIPKHENVRGKGYYQ